MGTVVHPKVTPQEIAQLLGDPFDDWNDGVEKCMEYRGEFFVCRFYWDVALPLGRECLAFREYDVELQEGLILRSNPRAKTASN
jgi:hypothetical protein